MYNIVKNNIKINKIKSILKVIKEIERERDDLHCLIKIQSINLIDYNSLNGVSE